MTDQQINEAIAEACGWKMYCDEAKEWKSKDDWVTDPDGFMKLRCDIPSYTTDLNAMHEAEKILKSDNNRIPEDEGKESDWDAYIFNLENVLARDYAEEDIYRHTVSAAAYQRAVAFVHTIGKWREE